MSQYWRGGNGFQRVTINRLMRTEGTAGDGRNGVAAIMTLLMIEAKDIVNAYVTPVCGVELKGGASDRRPYLYYLFLEPYWGKPDVRNLREGAGNVDDGGTRNPPYISKECVIR